MLRLELSIVIERSVEDIYALVGDPENDVKWQAAVLAVQKITAGPIGPGSRYRHTLRILGKRVSVDVEVAQRQPHTGYVLQCVSGPLAFETRVDLRRSGRGTRLSTVVEGRPNGMARIAAVALSHHRRAEIDRDLQRLKRMMEAGEL